MLFPEYLCLLRGGGDLATGVALRLHRAGFPIVVCELEHPLTVRRPVAVSSALTDSSGVVVIEGMTARRVDQVADLAAEASMGSIPVIVSPDLPPADVLPRSVVIDARLLKQNRDTLIDDAELVIALGPGYHAGRDCHAVIETLRGPDLGRVIFDGPAAADTGTPGEVSGHRDDRVLRAPADGKAQWIRQIGNRVAVDDLLGHVGSTPILASVNGVIRGLISEETPISANNKIGDIDPRSKVAIDRVSDKALAVAGGVLEAILLWINQST